MKSPSVARLLESLGGTEADPVTSATWGEGVSRVDWFPEERALVRDAVPERREEFARGRACLRAAIQALGGPAVPILRGPGREPRLPEGFTGSLTHSGDRVAAVVARSEWAEGLGIDIEVVGPLEPQVRALIVDGEEERRLLASSDLGVDAVRTLVFSAKESVHKAIFPASGLWLDFLDVEIRVSPRSDREAEGDWEEGAFEVIPRRVAAEVVGLVVGLEGRYAASPQVVTTVCRLCRPPV